ncbi:MAG: DUF4041 domain-containing protein [Clostridiales bacterium]|nr:DUF4041 domain-containing protein [Clostridiales bacterium]
MSLFGRKEKQELERMRAQLSPEQAQAVDLSRQIEESKKELAAIQTRTAAETRQLDTVRQQLEEARKQIVETDEAVLLQSFGMYTPHYSYSTSDEYKVKIKEVRDKQKAMLKAGSAVTGNTNWRVNDSLAKGKKMVSDMQKLLLRAYNAECDDAIEHVRFNNVEACEKKIKSSADAISKLGAMMGISLTSGYINLKLKELHLVHEYQVKKQDEKEAAKELRQKQREEAKAAKELEEARKKLEKEQSHYTNELSRLNIQIESAKTEAERATLIAKKEEIESHLGDLDKQIADVDYRAANQRAGYVYIISNIGAFGKDVYKIGMTRRLDPMERVDELGDASVPFNFDVHAMIFTEDAPGLEASLHNAFADRKVNFVNQRREFFHVTLDEIKQVVRENYDKTVEFIDIPPAEQYRQSLLMQKAAQK